jgi:hypothetical protein
LPTSCTLFVAAICSLEMLDPNKRTPKKAESGSSNSFSLDHGTELFTDIGSTDFLGFSFNNKDYQKQIADAVAKTGRFCAVTCTIRVIQVSQSSLGEVPATLKSTELVHVSILFLCKYIKAM